MRNIFYYLIFFFEEVDKMKRPIAVFGALILLGFSLRAAYAQKLALEPGSSSSYALDASGNLYSWGYNAAGQLGNGNSTDQYTPVKVAFPVGVTRWIAAAAGASHGLAIGGDGNLYAWGSNAYGQLGNSSNVSSPTPITFTKPAGVTSWSAVAAGDYHSLAIGSDGNLYTWGENNFGQLGIGNTTNQNSPQKVSLPAGVTSWTAVAAGTYYSLAIGNDGNIYAWGNNNVGQLGDSSTTNSANPVMVTKPAGVTGWTAVAASDLLSLAIANDGNLYSWGATVQSSLGTLNTVIPVVVSKPAGVSGWTAVAAGAAGQNFAIGDDGNLYAWGYNVDGELGDGNTTSGPTLVEAIKPSGVTTWTAVAAGTQHALAIGNDGYLYAWGFNNDGQLGVNSADNSPHSTPVNVLGVGGTGDLSLPVEVTAFSAESVIGSVVLDWRTQSEVDNAGFDILRQDPDSASFKIIASYLSDSNLKGQGTSTSGRSYSYTDRKVRPGGTYEYIVRDVSFDGSTQDNNPISVTVTLPNNFTLSQNYPNPFNPTTVISYQLSAVGNVTLKVYDVLGREVATLVNQKEAAGNYSVAFDGSKLASGVYFYRLVAGSYIAVKKLALLK